MDPTQAQAETNPATAASETEAGTPQPTLENASLEDLDAVQTEGARIAGVAGGGEGTGAESEAPVAEAAPETEPPAETPPPTGEETPPAEGEPPTAAPEPEEPRGEIPERFRFKDPTDRAIAAVKKAADVAGTPITWSEAERRVRGEPTAPRAEGPQVDPVAAVTGELESLQNEIAVLEAQIDPPEDSDEILSTKEMRAATVALAEKRSQLIKTELRLEGLQYQREGQRLTAVEQQKQAREASKTRALAEYPDAAKADTPLGKAITKRFEEMKDPSHPEHPILYADTAPERVTEIVAKELGIVAKPKTPSKPALPPTPVQKKATPVSGNKTAVPGKPAEAQDDKKSYEYLSEKASLDELDEFAGAKDGLAAAIR
jgi:hypothetical protein